MPRASSDDHVATDQSFAPHLDGRPTDEMGTAVPGEDASLRKALLVLLGCRVGEGAFEANEIRPVER